MVSDSFDDLLDDFDRWMDEDPHQALADALAAKMRREGRATADGADIDITTDSGSVVIDVERVRALANKILAGEA